MAQPRPPMLIASAAKNTTVGTRREKPSDFPSAVAQTASNSPDNTRTIHAMTASSRGRLVLSGYGSLVRRPPSRGLDGEFWQGPPAPANASARSGPAPARERDQREQGEREGRVRAGSGRAHGAPRRALAR